MGNQAALERDGLIERGRDLGAYMLGALTEAVGDHPIVGQVRGHRLLHRDRLRRR